MDVGLGSRTLSILQAYSAVTESFTESSVTRTKLVSTNRIQWSAQLIHCKLNQIWFENVLLSLKINLFSEFACYPAAIIPCWAECYCDPSKLFCIQKKEPSSYCNKHEDCPKDYVCTNKNCVQEEINVGCTGPLDVSNCKEMQICKKDGSTYKCVEHNPECLTNSDCQEQGISC